MLYLLVTAFNGGHGAQRIRPRSRGTQFVEATNTPPTREGAARRHGPKPSAASFWTIADATAPGLPSNPPTLPHPAPVDGGRDVGRAVLMNF